jgi:bile acid-coenzyme A ligase
VAQGFALWSAAFCEAGMGQMRTVSIGAPMLDPQPIGSLLTYQAQRDPDAPAYTFEGVTVTRAEMEVRCNRRARAFQKLGVKEGDFVTIGLANGLEFHETAMAVWKLGATPAPVSHKLPDHELRGIIDLVQPRLVVGFGQDRAPGFLTIEPGFEPDPNLSGKALPNCPPKYLKATTSGGSTGRPKVIVDHKPGLFDPKQTLLGMQVDDVILNPAPLYHNAPFGFTHMALCWGAHLVEMPKFDALETLRLIEAYKVRWMYLVPTMMNRIMALPDDVRSGFDLSSIELVIHMAAACPIWLKEKWIDWLGADKLWEVYAGTEGVGGTIISGQEWLDHKGSVGKINPTLVRLLSDRSEDALPGEVAEIYFRPPAGQGSTYHYIGAEPKLFEDWESYGDLGWLDEDGYLYLADRRTDMIISGGANIFPAEIEAALDAHPAIASSVVVGLPDADLGHRAHAILEVRACLNLPVPAELELFLSGRLARYKLPYTYEWVDEPLRSDAGKVRRSGLREERIASVAGGKVFPSLRSARKLPAR